MAECIYLSDILKIDNIKNARIRLNLRLGGDRDPMEYFKNGDLSTLLEGQYWNPSDKKNYQQGQTTIGLIKLHEGDLWLLFHVGLITKDLDVYDGVGYEHEVMSQYEKYFGRLVVRYKNKSMNMVRVAEPLMEQIEVVRILEDIYDNDLFPGYENIDLSWSELSRVINKESWITALKNQKGIYLITDRSNGKQYVGSASGDNMILSRWSTYIENGHGGNKQLTELSFEHMKENFRYSLLDIYKAMTPRQTILARETWWKNVLMTKIYGYNSN